MSQYYKYNREHKPVPSPVTLGIIAVTALVTVAQFLGPASIEDTLALWVYQQWQGEWWRILSYSLVHGNWLHVAMNLYMLWFLGVVFEETAGRKEFLLVYIASVLGGGIAICLMGDVVVSTVGASGGVYGVMGALLGFIYSRTGSVRGIMDVPFGRSLVILMGINIAISFMPGISMLGHVGGLIPGLLLGYLIERYQSKRLAEGEKIGALLLIALLIGGAWYATNPTHRHAFHVIQAGKQVGLKFIVIKEGNSGKGDWKGVAQEDVDREDLDAAMRELKSDAKKFDKSVFWAAQVRVLEFYLDVLDKNLDKRKTIPAEEIRDAFPPKTRRPKDTSEEKKSEPRREPSIKDRLFPGHKSD